MWSSLQQCECRILYRPLFFTHTHTPHINDDKSVIWQIKRKYDRKFSTKEIKHVIRYRSFCLDMFGRGWVTWVGFWLNSIRYVHLMYNIRCCIRTVHGLFSKLIIIHVPGDQSKSDYIIVYYPLKTLIRIVYGTRNI